MSTDFTTDQPNYLEYQGKHGGMLGWLLSTDHKRIGLLYLVTMLILFFVGVSLGFVMRLVQLTRFHSLITAQTYNALFTLHGVIMIFLFRDSWPDGGLWQLRIANHHWSQGRRFPPLEPRVLVLLPRWSTPGDYVPVYRQRAPRHWLDLLCAI